MSKRRTKALYIRMCLSPVVTCEEQRLQALPLYPSPRTMTFAFVLKKTAVTEAKSATAWFVFIRGAGR